MQLLKRTLPWLSAVLAPLAFLAPLTGCFVSTEKERVIEKQDNPPVVEHDKTVIEHNSP